MEPHCHCLVRDAWKTFELLLNSVSTVSTFPGELDLFEERGRQVRLHGRQELWGHLRRKVHRGQRVSGEEMLPSWWSNAAGSAYTLQRDLSVVASIDSINLLHWDTHYSERVKFQSLWCLNFTSVAELRLHLGRWQLMPTRLSWTWPSNARVFDSLAI